MGRIAERVYTSQDDIARIESLVEQLPGEARVVVRLVDGSEVVGTVSVRPTVQTFLDGDKHEGLNGIVRIDDASDPARAHYIWLDRIAGVRHLDSA